MMAFVYKTLVGNYDKTIDWWHCVFLSVTPPVN